MMMMMMMMIIIIIIIIIIIENNGRKLARYRPNHADIRITDEPLYLYTIFYAVVWVVQKIRIFVLPK